jgi:hypothetical protein
MKAKAAFYFLILCQKLLSLERYRRKKGVEVSIAELKAFYGTKPTTLKRKFDLCIPGKETARPHSQFLHSYICE